MRRVPQTPTPSADVFQGGLAPPSHLCYIQGQAGQFGREHGAGEEGTWVGQYRRKWRGKGRVQVETCKQVDVVRACVCVCL